MRISERAEQKKKYFIEIVSAHPILVPVSLFGLAFYFGLGFLTAWVIGQT